MMISKKEYMAELSRIRKKNSENLRLVTDQKEIDIFEKKTGKWIGKFDNQPYYDFRADLYENVQTGNKFRYCSVEYNNDKPGAASLIVIHTQEHQKEEEYILLIKNYRVFIDQELWELPRGFANIDDPNSWSGALREILEETGIDLTSHTYKSQNLGEVYTDTGLTNSKVVLYRIDLFCKEESLDFHNIDKDEMICGYKLVSTKQISSISKDIHDSFTLCALAKAFL